MLKIIGRDTFFDMTSWT